MCNLNDGQLMQIVHALTAKRKPQNYQRWIKGGFRKVSADRLFIYWKKKISQSPEMLELACNIFDQYKKNLEQNHLNQPSPAEMARNLAASMANWVKSGFKVVSKEVFEQRMGICNTCEFWEQNAIGGRCLKCGCATQAKLRLAHEKCPEDKWLPDSTD